jgi:hypothetical protein
MKSINCSKPRHASITYSKIEHPCSSIFTTIFNDSSNLIMIISWDNLNFSLAIEHVADIAIPTHVITNVAPGGSANWIAIFTSN